MKTDAAGKTRISTNRLIAAAIAFGIVIVIAISMVAASGNPDPTSVAKGAQSTVTSIVNGSIIVFREGLEATLIFAAITASFLGARQGYRKPVLIGVGAAFGATVITWFLMTTVVKSLPLSDNALLALTGLIAVAVLLVIMNWFFHKIYWTDHIKELNSKKRGLVNDSESGERMRYWGFVALGFTSVYREGFEVVLFLQNLNLVAGGRAVFFGTLLGLGLTAVVGFLTFFLHHKLPYKKMLVLTGVLLGVVLVVMIGGSARTLQDLHILGNTPLPMQFPAWWARWFELVPTYQTVAVQLCAALFVVGSYYAAEWWAKERRRRALVAFTADGMASSDGVLVAMQSQGLVAADETLCGEPVLTEYVMGSASPIATPALIDASPVPGLVDAVAGVPVVPTPAEQIVMPARVPHAQGTDRTGLSTRSAPLGSSRASLTPVGSSSDASA
jgi:high-affinity iron transporter